MNAEQFDAVAPDDTLWMRTGHYTASRVRVISKDGNGAVRRLWVEVIDRAPSQPTTDDINDDRGLPISYMSVEPL